MIIIEIVVENQRGIFNLICVMVLNGWSVIVIKFLHVQNVFKLVSVNKSLLNSSSYMLQVYLIHLNVIMYFFIHSKFNLCIRKYLNI